jgi:hypothetical protein
MSSYEYLVTVIETVTKTYTVETDKEIHSNEEAWECLQDNDATYEDCTDSFVHSYELIGGYEDE